jgi:hypothetical protein
VPLPIIADVYRIALLWTDTPTSSHAVNVIHVRQAGTTAAAIAATMDANVTANMWGVETVNTKVTTVTVTKLDGSSASSSLAVTGAKWAGTAAAGDMIPAMAAVVKMQSLFRGRSQRGRVFLPFVAESQSTNGVLGAGAVAAMQTAWTNWVAAMVAAGAQPVIASYLHASQVDVASVTVEATAATQRRRQSRLR